jgi:hypothetical protein
MKLVAEIDRLLEVKAKWLKLTSAVEPSTDQTMDDAQTLPKI